MSESLMLHHGGDLESASRQFGITVDEWLDLSTGVNPFAWPVPVIPPRVWYRLPHRAEELLAVAREYYGHPHLLAVPGSQFAIQTLPKLFAAGTTVAIPGIGYQEHRHGWSRAGHRVLNYDYDSIETCVADPAIDVLVLINPNNPGCQRTSPETITSWLDRLQRRQATLIIDEAFVDCMPEYSMAGCLRGDNLIILRSLGKFFGLAGLRLGFVLASPVICERLQDQLGPWAVSGPAQWVGSQALADQAWQEQTHKRLADESEKLFSYLLERFSPQGIAVTCTPLFVSLWLHTAMAGDYYARLGQAGILSRLIEIDGRQACLRFGLVEGKKNWHRFRNTVDNLTGIPPTPGNSS